MQEKKVDNIAMRKTEASLEQSIVTLIAIGTRYADISQKTGVAVQTIKKIKKRNHDKLNRVEERVIERHADEVSKMLNKTYYLINRLLDKDEEGLIELSIKDVLLISNEMCIQSTINLTPSARRQNLNSVYKKYL